MYKNMTKRIEIYRSHKDMLVQSMYMLCTKLNLNMKQARGFLLACHKAH